MNTILVVDDQAAVLSVTARYLERVGYRVLTASRAAEALAKAQAFSGTIDLLVTDVVMPGMNGPQLARELSLTRPEMSTLFMSGYAGGALAEGVDLLAKPFTLGELDAAVRTLMERIPLAFASP